MQQYSAHLARIALAFVIASTLGCAAELADSAEAVEKSSPTCMLKSGDGQWTYEIIRHAISVNGALIGWAKETEVKVETKKSFGSQWFPEETLVQFSNGLAQSYDSTERAPQYPRVGIAEKEPVCPYRRLSDLRGGTQTSRRDEQAFGPGGSRYQAFRTSLEGIAHRGRDRAGLMALEALVLPNPAGSDRNVVYCMTHYSNSFSPHLNEWWVKFARGICRVH